ncbi:MAG: class I SAM-dependent methyltransferase [Lachnospiraceae bacterium]|nr:class I SAM-dependent methyltransferase [Lachnospiraceae bacterium]
MIEKEGLIQTEKGLALCLEGQMIQGDFVKMAKRLTHANLSHELLVKACKIKNADAPLTIIDATAGLGEDALLLAAAGHNIILYERDEIIAALLEDTIKRAMKDASLSSIVTRMELHKEDSITALHKLTFSPDIIYLDPMFPKREKTGLVKKKFQVIHVIEKPCEDEESLLSAALSAGPKRIVIKRPLKAEYLANKKPSYSIEGKSIRYDCIVL